MLEDKENEVQEINQLILVRRKVHQYITNNTLKVFMMLSS